MHADFAQAERVHLAQAFPQLIAQKRDPPESFQGIDILLSVEKLGELLERFVVVWQNHQFSAPNQFIQHVIEGEGGDLMHFRGLLA